MDGAEARNVGVRSRPRGWGADADWRTSYGRVEHAHGRGDVLVQPAALQELVEGHHAILIFVHFLHRKNNQFFYKKQQWEGRKKNIWTSQCDRAGIAYIQPLKN